MLARLRGARTRRALRYTCPDLAAPRLLLCNNVILSNPDAVSMLVLHNGELAKATQGARSTIASG